MSRSLLSRLRPQFSLRMLLFAMTGFSILFALGYVWWPTVERSKVLKGNWEHEPEIYQWRVVHREYNDFRGNPVKHGPLRVYDLKGNLLREEHWRHGVRHGPWKQTALGYEESGMYLDGKEHGIWVEGTSKLEWRTEREYQRGELLRHTQYGVEDPFKSQELRRVYEERFRGKSRVSMERYFPNGVVQFRTLYKDEKPHGPSEGWHERGPKSYSGAWRDGWPVGNWTIYDDSGNLLKTLDLDQGPLAIATRRFVDGAYRAQEEEGYVNVNKDAAKWLSRPLPMSFISRESFSNQMEFCGDFSKIRLEVSPRRLNEVDVDPDAPNPLLYPAMPVAVGLPLLLHERGLAADYRHGTFVVTNLQDAESWKDRTGIDAILADETSLLRAKMSAGAYEQGPATSVAEIFELYATRHGFEVQADWEAIARSGTPPDTRILNSLNGILLKHALGLLCDEHRLHCREENGKLIVEPLIDRNLTFESANR